MRMVCAIEDKTAIVVVASYGSVSRNRVCVRVMFNNHYNYFLAYTSQTWPDKKRNF